MKRLIQMAVVGAILLVGLSIATAQTPQPVVRLGNYIEVGNDLFMHIIATSDIRYKTVENLDFESGIRDQVTSRSPSSTAQHETEGDLLYAELRFGADFRYQKSLTFQLMFENQFVFDGNLIDDRSNSSNPGGTSVFGQGASTENPGFRVERFWARYKFIGTPVALFVGAELKKVSQAGIFGNDDPGIGLEAEFGDLQVWAKAYIERESQRLGLQNDNDLVSYVFGGAYDLKPHRFGFDVVYFRDRFSGADTAVTGCRSGLGCTGQKTDSVWVNASWTGRLGPVRGLLQGNLMLGTARGTTAASELPPGVPRGRDYDIFSGAVIAFAEVDLGIVRPFVGFFWGSADGDPRDNKLHGFADPQPQGDSTQAFTGLMAHLDKSTAAGGTRDYSCPGRLRGARSAAPANNPYAIGTGITAAGGGPTSAAAAECYHGVARIWNSQLGRDSHVGLEGISYSNPGTMVIPVGLRTFPVKGHEITGWYVYRALVDSALLETAFAPEIAAGRINGIGTGLYHEVGGFWMWTLNPHFDIRLAGNIGIATGGSKDLARLSDCNPNAAGIQSCEGEDVALKAEARFRARF